MAVAPFLLSFDGNGAGSEACPYSCYDFEATSVGGMRKPDIYDRGASGNRRCPATRTTNDGGTVQWRLARLSGHRS